MTDIRAFGGIHYNPLSVKDLTQVLCPPYDVISPARQQELYDLSDNNFVRIEFGRELPQDNETDNRYTRASVNLNNWLEKGILQEDSQPAIYVHDHRYRYGNREYCRRSITCLVKLEEWDKMVVRPHEGTFSRAKSDRLSILWTLQANTSPILALYDDTDNNVAVLVESATPKSSLLHAEYENGKSHNLWSIEDADVINNLKQYFAQQPLYIADGHHRYESALTYRRERRFGASESGEAPYDFVMMSLMEFNDPGLLILPAHRLLGGISRRNLTGLISGLESCFTVRKIPSGDRSPDDVVKLLSGKGKNKVSLVLYGLLPEYYLLLETREDITLNQVLPDLHADYNQKLGVSVVDHLILEGIMGFTPEAIGSLLSYTHDAREAVSLVQSQEYQLAFLVNPVTPTDIKSVADSGGRMPKKSTYFYPKMPAGLIFYSFVQ